MILITKDSKDEIRYLKLILVTLDNSYRIDRFSGKLKGKEVKQPPLLIKTGKVKRTVKEQAELEYNSLVNKALNKGYKPLSDFTNKSVDDLTLDEVKKLFGLRTDNKGIRKPMLAKETSNAKPELWEKCRRISKKLDGCRCLFYWDNEDNMVRTSSRGGKSYDAATTHIRNNDKLIRLLKERPHVMLDGELYVHGMSLQEISGICRLKDYDSSRCDILEFHCYDLAVDNIIFQDRLVMLENMKNYFIDDKHIKVLDHYEVTTYMAAKKYHDLWVSQGYEGAILRDPMKEYKFGGRDIRMLKLKEFQDAEFEIIGCTEGLRGSEDMVFNLKTKEGVTFEAKPIGPRELKERYVKDINKIIGQKGTVKYFYMTEDGRPFLPVFKCVRNYE